MNFNFEKYNVPFDHYIVDNFLPDDIAKSISNDFLDYENQLLDNIDIIRHIPSVIVQGRYDVVCPPTTAYELHRRWPESELKIAPFSGHSAFEKEISKLLVEATDKFSKN